VVKARMSINLAVFSDIHGNIQALNSVVDDIKKKNIDVIICAGDLVQHGANPNEVIDKIRSEKILSIMGNCDEEVFGMAVVCNEECKNAQEAHEDIQNLQFNREKITNDNMDYLRNLPRELVLSFGGCNGFKPLRIKFVHGSPRRIDEHMYEDSNVTKEIMATLQEDVLVCGHTHYPFAAWYGEKLLVNTGTVGRPKDGKVDAEYSIIKISSAINQPIKIGYEMVTVIYDNEAAADAVKLARLPENFTKPILTGSK
jgi:putative phosphoesterase